MDDGQVTILQRKARTVRISNEGAICMLRAYLAHPTKWSDVIDDIKQNINHFNDQTKDLYGRSTVRQLRDRLSSKLSTLMAMAPENIRNVEIRDLVRQVRVVETRHVDGGNIQRQQQQPDQQLQQRQHQPQQQRHQPQQHQPQQQQPQHQPRQQRHQPQQQQRHQPQQQQRHQPQQRQQQPSPEANAEPPEQPNRAAPPHVDGAGGAGNADIRNNVIDNFSQSSSDDHAGHIRERPIRRKRPLAQLIRENQEIYNNFMKKRCQKF